MDRFRRWRFLCPRQGWEFKRLQAMLTFIGIGLKFLRLAAVRTANHKGRSFIAVLDTHHFKALGANDFLALEFGG